MTTKKTIQFYANIAQVRNHELISLSNIQTPSQGSITIFCKTCKTSFTTTARSYQNARKTGCPQCKAKTTSENWKGKIRTKSPEEASKQAVLNEYKQQKHLQKGLAYAHISNKEDLKIFLKESPNVYNNFILQRIDHPVIGKYTENHHIIPKHTGGPHKRWNLIKLTPEDHMEAHRLRALVYNEAGDHQAIRFRTNPSELVERRLRGNQIANETRLRERTGIYAEGASSKGGRIGGLVKSHEKDLKQSTKMSQPVLKALYEGSRWKHLQSGTELNLQPNRLFTLPQLVQKLLEALPPCKDKEVLERAKTSTVTSNLARVIKKQRPSAYGWITF
jgi:RNA polymerase subunit RPABC4/transcription elongation factor Spt4